MSARRGLVLVLVLAGVALGALREFLFLNLNYQLDHVARHTAFSYAHSLFQGWVGGLGLRGLLVLKWALACAFIAAMSGLTIALARTCFGSFRHARAILLATIAFAALALALHGLAHWVPALERVSVQLLHMLQYPVPLLFVLAAALGWGRRTDRGASAPEGH